MSYIVSVPFTDAQDNNYAYGIGDTYPRKGYTPSKSRIKDLLNGTNKRNISLIEETEGEAEVETETETEETGGYDF